MSVPDSISRLEGVWKGTNRLNLSWLPDPISESQSSATVSLRVNGQFAGIAYTWEYDGKPQEGLLILGSDNHSDAVQAVWTDSWHSSHKFMLCDGAMLDDGSVKVSGAYSVPDNPDWGWRIEIYPGKDVFTCKMYNISPEGQEEWAVETEFTRV